MLLKAGANRHVRDVGGKDALAWALERGFENIAYILKNDPLRTSIFKTVAEGDYRSTVALFKQGVDPNSVDESIEGEKATPLIVAAKYNCLDIVRLCCTAPDIQINYLDSKGRTALYHAAINGHEHCCVALLKEGADRGSIADEASAVGQYATAAIVEANPLYVHIHDACEKGAVLIVSALLLQGCPPSYKDERVGKMQRTPLMAACTSSANQHVVKFLLAIPEVVESIDELDTKGMSALMIACSVAALESTAQLLRAGANRNIKNCLTRHTAADYAGMHSITTYLTFLSQTFVISEH
jgi:ankyrin repeat protein